MGLRRPSDACGPHCICFLPVNIDKARAIAGSEGMRFTKRSATKGSSNTCERPKPEISIRMGDFNCSVTSSGLVATVASLHVHTATFDEEKWKLITLTCSHMADCHHLFAPSSGSVEDFTDIKVDVDANPEITANMRNYCFFVSKDWWILCSCLSLRYEVFPEGSPFWYAVILWRALSPNTISTFDDSFGNGQEADIRSLRCAQILARRRHCVFR